MGMNVNALNLQGRTSLLYHLSERRKVPVYDFLMFNHQLDLLIYENSCTALNSPAVALAIEYDKIIFSDYRLKNLETQPLWGSNEKILLDRLMEIPIFFTGLLLLECEFPAPRDLQVVLEEDNSLHPVEQAYIHNILVTPRRLTYRCRDVIRTAFNGRRLHDFAKE